MALTLSSLVTNVKSAFQSHSGSIRNTTVALLVFGLNAVVQSEDFFQCPPDNFVFYASCFFIIPALFFLWRRFFFTADFGTMFVDAVITKVRTSEEQNGTAFVCFQDGLAVKLLWKSYF